MISKVITLINHCLKTRNFLNKTILIVEDNLELREYLKFELKNQYKVLEAPNGKNGLEIARKINQISLLLM